jgi:hypothetical protein
VPTIIKININEFLIRVPTLQHTRLYTTLQCVNIYLYDNINKRRKILLSSYDINIPTTQVQCSNQWRPISSWVHIQIKKRFCVCQIPYERFKNYEYKYELNKVLPYHTQFPSGVFSPIK